MKIKELWIEEYKILKDFNIAFEEQLTVLIGGNGSGKSTILEFLSNVFYELYKHFVLNKGEKPKFDFKIRYSIEVNNKEYEIYIASNKKTKEYYEVNIKKEEENSKKYSKTAINEEFKSAYKDIFPQNVVIYYSGISTILKDSFLSFQEKHILASLNGEKKIEQPFFYFLPENFSTILISLLAYQYGDIPEILEKQFKISGFKEIVIKLKKPNWAKNEEFWGARGELKVFLEEAFKATKKSENSQLSSDNIVFKYETKEELEKLWSFYGEEKSLFQYLETLQANDLIEDIEIVLFKDGEEISFKRLSEGEKQILIVYGLKELLITENSLFLFDEPDTYLHPEWQKDFIEHLIKSDEKSKTNYFITSHSPNIISGLHKNQLKIIENIDNKTSVREFSFNPYGKPVDMILIDYFGLKGLRYKEIDEKIQNLKKLLKTQNYDKNQFNNLLEELENQIGRDDIDLLSIKLEKIRMEKANEKDK